MVAADGERLLALGAYVLLILLEGHKGAEVYSLLLKEPVGLVDVRELFLKLRHPLLHLTFLLKLGLYQILLPLHLWISNGPLREKLWLLRARTLRVGHRG